MKSPTRQYAWDKFRDYDDENQESTEWAATQDEEDRRVLELEVEAMIEESIPKRLEPLLLAYKACDWTAKPKNADRDLREAILTVVIEDCELDAGCVVARLQFPPDLECETYPPQIESPPPRPQVELPFPRHRLDAFIWGLDHYYQRTIREFEMNYRHFLDGLPETVRATLESCYINLAVPALMDRLRGQSIP